MSKAKNRIKNRNATITENMAYFSHMQKGSYENHNTNNYWANNFWQSANWNMRSFMMYRDWLRAIALNRIKWVNLPQTCNARFLEFTLLNEGVASIAKPENLPFFFSTKVALSSRPNVYDNYSKWLSIGNNGWQFNANIKSGEIVWNNMERLPILSQIDLFARRLAWFDRVIDSNCKNQMNPIFITGDQRQANTMIQLTKQIMGGEPVIVGNDGLSKTEIQALNLNVPFISENVEMVKEQVMAQFYTFIGVQNTPRKSERMIEEEVAGYTEPVIMNRLNALTPRREAADNLNEKFGLNIQVYWNDDLDTTNYWMSHNKEKQAELNINDGGGKNE